MWERAKKIFVDEAQPRDMRGKEIRPSEMEAFKAELRMQGRDVKTALKMLKCWRCHKAYRTQKLIRECEDLHVKPKRLRGKYKKKGGK